MLKRRTFLGLVPTLALINTATFAAEKTSKFPISCNAYNWFSFYKRDKKTWGENLDSDIREFKKSGITAYEPSIDNAEHARKIIRVLKEHEILMPSIYVNSVLHLQAEGDKAIENIVGIAKVIKTFGTKIIVTNPTPIEWGKPTQKTDDQLVLQAKMLDKLGALLRKEGIVLAYHTHDMELKGGAREFHHMMQNTSPANMSFCMDTHWIYRGSDNSSLPVFDVLKMYSKRIVELHIRQSQGGIWSETFSATGDIDYTAFVRELASKGIKPHIVIEQCVEDNSPNTMKAVEAHVINLKEIKKTFNI